jgi:hypothetical protein
MELLSALLGALVGGFFAIWGAQRQFRTERKRRVLSLSAALATEIASLVELARRNRYVEELRAIVALVQSPSFDGQLVFISTASQAYFTVFEANAGDVGELEPKLAVEVIAFYQQARSCLDGLTMLSRMEPGKFGREEIVRYYTLLADTIMLLCQFGDALVARLAPDNVSKHILHTARKIDANELYRSRAEADTLPRHAPPVGQEQPGQ